MVKTQSCILIKNEWDIVGARQRGRDIAKAINLGIVDQARVATAISELARNIYLYAQNGRICFEIVERITGVESTFRKGIKITAIDEGPGIEDVSEVMEDGYSTSNGLGAGLPGVKRLMDEFQIDSEVGIGTKIEVVKWLR